MGIPYLVVGLGNPGENYRHTRHNVGFRVVEELVVKHDVKLKEKDEAIWGSFKLQNHDIFLFFPQTYMNDSGRAVGPFARYRNIDIKNILVISDDLDLPVGRLRLKTSGGSGGHHGLDSIIACLNSKEFPRLRLGVGKPSSAEQGPNHVLSGFTPDDKLKMEKVVERAMDGVETFLLKGPVAAMQELNGDLPEAE